MGRTLNICRMNKKSLHPAERASKCRGYPSWVWKGEQLSDRWTGRGRNHWQRGCPDSSSDARMSRSDSLYLSKIWSLKEEEDPRKKGRFSIKWADERSNMELKDTTGRLLFVLSSVK